MGVRGQRQFPGLEVDVLVEESEGVCPRGSRGGARQLAQSRQQEVAQGVQLDVLRLKLPVTAAHDSDKQEPTREQKRHGGGGYGSKSGTQVPGRTGAARTTGTSLGPSSPMCSLDAQNDRNQLTGMSWRRSVDRNQRKTMS